MGKPTICICENKDADQFRSNCKADQHLCFCLRDSTIPLLSKSKTSKYAYTCIMHQSFVTTKSGDYDSFQCPAMSPTPRDKLEVKTLLFAMLFAKENLPW